MKCWGRERGRAKGQADNTGARVDGLGLAVNRWAGPEPCDDWSQLLVQGGWAWCEGTWKNTRGTSSRVGPGQDGAVLPAWHSPAGSLLACRIRSFHNAWSLCAHTVSMGGSCLAGHSIPCTLKSELFSIPCPIFPAQPTPPILQGPVPLSPKSPPDHFHPAL